MCKSSQNNRLIQSLTLDMDPITLSPEWSGQMEAVVVEAARSEGLGRPLWRRHLRLWLATAVALLVVVPAGAEGAPPPVTTPTLAFVLVSAGNFHTCALTPSGDARCWGRSSNSEGESPALRTGPFTAISAGVYNHTCALRADKSIDCWGSNLGGQAPAHVAGSYSSVSAGAYHTCALKVDGDVTCWGSNESGLAPPRVAGPFTAVSAGNSHTCAVRADRDIACWGSNSHGAAPPLVQGPFTSVSAATYNTCAVQADGDISCWGTDSYGQAPTEVGGPFTAVSAGFSHTCGLRTNGNIACWGSNANGQAPAAVAGPFKSVSAGGSHTCAIRVENLVSCWGSPLLMPAPPAPPGPPPAAGTVGKRYRHVFTAPASSPVTFSAQGALPTGVTLATTTLAYGDSTEGTLSGVPRAVGTFTFTVSARNMFGVTSSDATLKIGPTKKSDLNGDGLPDLAVGAPGEDVGSIADSGIVTVLYGAADGTYGRAGSLVISQETVGQVTEKGDRFGAAIAVAEVTGDDQLDLIIGSPGENAGAGQVVVVHGSPTGLTGGGRTVLRQGRGGAAGTAEAGDGFGSAVSVGAGGALWVGAPGEDYGSIANAGVVTRFLTRPVRATGSVQYHQGARGVPGIAERGDRFGASLGGGGAAIGAPGEDVGSIVDAGTVTWELTGSMSQNTAGVPGAAERGDQFGAAVSSRIVKDYNEEIEEYQTVPLFVVGAPGEDIGTLKDAGAAVLMWRDWSTDPSSCENMELGDTTCLGIVQSTAASSSQRVEAGDRFGASVYLSSSGDSLIIGAPGEDVGSILDAGAVTVLPVGVQCYDLCFVGIDGDGPTHIQGRDGVPGVARAGNEFGASISELPGIDGGIVAGAPGQTVDGHPSAGTITVLNPQPLPAQELHQNSQGVSGVAETGDRFYRLSAP